MATVSRESKTVVDAILLSEFMPENLHWIVFREIRW